MHAIISRLMSIITDPNQDLPTRQKPEIKENPAVLKLNLKLAPGTSLKVEIETSGENGEPLGCKVVTFKNSASDPSSGSTALQDTSLNESTIKLPYEKANLAHFSVWKEQTTSKWNQIALSGLIGKLDWLFWAAIAIYLITRLIGLGSFPIYFFTDEAIQTINAADFIRDGFQSFEHEFFPTYFVNGNQYNLSTSVYLQILPYLLFGKSIFVTRATSVFVSCFASISMGMALKHGYKSRFPWLGVLFLSITPAWFLHSRTAFETVLATTFFAVFLYAYLMYRVKNPRYFYWVVGFAALCFYSYSPAQLVVAVCAVLLLFSDLHYHWENRKVVIRGIGIGLLFILPYFRFLMEHGEQNYHHLVILHSYWISDISILEKLQIFFTQYLRGLNPAYWYVPNVADFARHQMKDYGHILRLTFPFVAIGLWQVLRRIRQSPYRLVLIALLAAPAGAALVELGITRALFMVIPLALLTALGVSACLDWLGKIHLPLRMVEYVIFLILAGVNIFMLVDSLKNAPTWFDDYGLGGMQYGARQVFGEIRDYLQENPDTHLILSPSWANGTDVLARFFFDDPIPFQLGSIEGFMNEQRDIQTNTIFVMIPQEYQMAMNSNKFRDVEVESIIPYPDGTPGFYFVRLQYADNIAEILEAERAARSVMTESVLTLQDGAQATVHYPVLDMGDIYTLFDDDPLSIARTFEANPMRILIEFDQAQTYSGVDVRVGGVETEVVVVVFSPGGGSSQAFTQRVNENPDPRTVSIEFDTSLTMTSMEVSVRSVRDGEPAHVHVWEIMLR